MVGKNFLKNKQNNPGPGSYKPLEKENGGGMSFGKSTRDFRRKINQPGPGEYNQRV